MENLIFIVDFKNVCRICLQESKSLNNLFENNFQYNNYSIAEILRNSMLIKIEEDESLPNSICARCEAEIVQIYEFKSKYEKSCEYLQNHLLNINTEDFKKEDLIYLNRVDSEEDNNDIIIIELPENEVQRYEEIQIKEESTVEEIEEETEFQIDNNENLDKLRIYSCKKCEASFTTKSKLRMHKRNLLHYIRKSIKCTKCNLVVPLQNYKSHILKHSINLKCEKCDKKFHNAFNLRRHLFIHTKQTPYSCEFCESKFARQDKLKEHMMIHTGEQLLICKACGQQFENHNDLKEHLDKSKTCVDNFENRYKRNLICDICTKSFVLASSLQLHKLSHTDARVICTDCGKPYPNEKKLKHHWLQVHNKLKSDENNFLCYICAKQFNNKLCFERHISCHMGIKKMYTCNICNKRFTQSGSMMLHIKIHTGEKPFVCHICSKAFNKQSNMQRHLKIHNNIRPFDCNICGKKFSVKHSLVVHTRIHTGEKPYVCSVCGKDFVDCGSLGRHFKTHNRRINYNPNKFSLINKCTDKRLE